MRDYDARRRIERSAPCGASWTTVRVRATDTLRYWILFVTGTSWRGGLCSASSSARMEPASRFTNKGIAQRPTLVMVHGWPDSHVLWNGVTGELGDRFHIVRYDNRGAGDSDVPKPVAAYRMDRFADDLSAVIDAVSPRRPVHVLAHDWGSVGAWEYLSRPEASARVASFTSVSGPSTDHYGTFVRSRLARPYRPIRFAKAVNLASRFSYWIPFSIPVIAPALMRRGRRAPTAGHRHPRSQVPVRDARHRRGQLAQDLPRQRDSLVHDAAQRPLRDGAGAADLQRPRSCGARARLRRRVQVGTDAAAP